MLPVFLRTTLPALLLGSSACLSSAPADPAIPADTQTRGCPVDIMVTSAADSGAGSLRAAITDLCDGGRVRFNQRLDIQLQSPLAIAKPIVIDASGVAAVSAGQGDALLRIRGGSNHRVFQVTVTGALTLIRVRISDGRVAQEGGGIHSLGQLQVSHCQFDGNSAASGNLGGGAIFAGVGSSLKVEHSTFTGNSAVRGSAIFNSGTAELFNSTFSGNRGATNEGAIQNRRALVANHITVTDNGRTDATPTAGGLFSFDAETTLINSILAGNSGRDCFISGGTVDTVALLALNINNCPAQVMVNPQLASLANNGGRTFTHLPAANSPALDVADPAFCLPQDQRGFLRQRTAACDLGAVEREGVQSTIFSSGFES